MKGISLPLALLLVFFLGAPVLTANAQAEQVLGARKVLNKVQPAYPRLAQQMSLTGTVKLEVVVTEAGSVKSVQVRGGSPVLAESAQDAVRHWKWEKSDHQSVELVQFDFHP